jgi:nicotinate (nicotinamide) nucleotide adenylyltransferase
MKNIGLYFGSFNPIHIGHLMIANYAIEYGNVDEIWFVVSPQNPFKAKKDLLDERERLKLLELSIQGDSRFKISDVEFSLPQPSYTINTLEKLSHLHNKFSFTILCGMDSLNMLPNWRRSNDIVENYHILVYPRKGYDGGMLLAHPNVNVIEAPEVEISSTFIRQGIKDGKDLRYFMPQKAYDYMTSKGFYKA